MGVGEGCSGPAEITDRDLVEQVLAREPGWEDAWWTLLRRARAVIQCVAMGRGRDPDALSFELWAYVRRDSWRPLAHYNQYSSIRFSCWAATVALKLVHQGAGERSASERLEVKTGREGGRVVEALERLTGTEPAEPRVYVWGEAATAVQQAIARLPHLRSQEVLRRYYYRGQSFSEIALSMRVDRTLVRKMHHQNRRLLGVILLQTFQQEGPRGELEGLRRPRAAAIPERHSRSALLSNGARLSELTGVTVGAAELEHPRRDRVGSGTR